MRKFKKYEKEKRNDPKFLIILKDVFFFFTII